MKDVKNKRMEIRLSQEEKEKIEKLAKELDMPTGTLLRNLALSSYDDAMIFKKLGILKGAKSIKDFKEKFSSLFENKLPGLNN